MKKQIALKVMSLLLVVILCTGLASCMSFGNEQLSAPTYLRVDDVVLKWNFVEHATSYVVKVVEGANADINTAMGSEVIVNSTEYSLKKLADGDYTLGVKARDDSSSYSNSPYTSIQYTRRASVEDEVTGLFGAFDEANTKHSFLGYGINIIKAPRITSKYVEVEYPIFKRDLLMKENLLKINETESVYTSVEGSSIDIFMNNLSMSASMSSGSMVSAAGNIKGVDVGGSFSLSKGLQGAFAKSSETVKSQYFLKILAENRSYWLVLQTAESRYKELLDENFKADLYSSSITPERLFQKYGTHLLTSVAMGGVANLDYKMESESEETTLNILGNVSSKISTAVEARVAKYGAGASENNSASISSGYSNYAAENNVKVTKIITTYGGSVETSISSEELFASNYDKWVGTLDTNPVLIGVKSENSLYPIWNLIDRSTPEAEARYNELYNYFVLYGSESYAELCALYNITPAQDDNVIEISTPDDLELIRSKPDGNFILTGNINMTIENFEPIPSFSGTLDGNGFSIVNWTMPRTSAKPNKNMTFGLFGTNTGTIKNLTMKYVNFSGYSIYYNSGDKVALNPKEAWYFSAGTLAAINKGQIINCGVEGATINVKQCLAELESSINMFIGGLVGYNQGTMKNVYATNCEIVAWNGADGQHRYSKVRTATGGVLGVNLTNAMVYGIYSHDNKVTSTAMGGCNAHMLPQYVWSYAGGIIGENGGTVNGAIAYNNGNNIKATTQKYSSAPDTRAFAASFVCLNHAGISNYAVLEGEKSMVIKSATGATAANYYTLSSLEEINANSVLSKIFKYDSATRKLSFVTQE